jgi:hypothetical protein
MNPDNTIGNLGIALGLLGANGECDILLNGEWQLVVGLTDGGDRFVNVDDVLLILQAEEIR